MEDLCSNGLMNEMSPLSERGTHQNTKSDFFASPPEPLFNHWNSGLCPELLQQSLETLAKLNDIAVSTGRKEEVHYCFKTTNAVSYFFHLCHHFNLPYEVQYRAIDLFHRFMTKHVMELYEHVESTQNSSSPINWQTVEGRLKHQISLRAVTCVQLASKLSLHYKIVSINKARAFLTKCGFRYAPSSLVQSEIRVLKTLEFHVHDPTSLDYIEIILETLGHNDPSLPVKQLHGVGLKVLDVFYTCSNTIFVKLTGMVYENNKQPVIESDLILLASAVIGAAAFVLNQTRSDNIVKAVSQITCIVPDDILDFSALLIENIMTIT